MKPRLQKRQEAEARQADRAQRSPAQQLARLNAAGWTAKRERARLEAEITKERKAA